MTRSEMKAVLASGGTVLHNGRHIKRDSDLPSETELALNNGTEPDALAAVSAQLARLTEEKLALEKALAAKEQSEKKPVKAETAFVADVEKATVKK